jgi:hypothetical protein
MQPVRLVRALGLLLVAGLATPMAGCGSGPDPGLTPEKKAAEKAIAASIRKSYQEKMQQGAAAAAEGRDFRKGMSRAKSGP